MVTNFPPVASTQVNVGPTAIPEAVTRASAKPKTRRAIKRSKIRSRSHAANCDVTETFSFMAMR
jgi:hypothetical protein